MSASSVTRRARRAAEALMVDACDIKPITGHTTNPDGTVTPTYGSSVYQGKCKLQQQRTRYASNPEAGEHAYTVGPMELHLPVSGTDQVASDHHVEITDSFDSANIGRVFRISIGARKTFASALRVIVEEVTA